MRDVGEELHAGEGEREGESERGSSAKGERQCGRVGEAVVDMMNVSVCTTAVQCSAVCSGWVSVDYSELECTA